MLLKRVLGQNDLDFDELDINRYQEIRRMDSIFLKKQHGSNMNNVPIPLTLEEVVIRGGIEGSEDAYENEHGFDYAGPDSAFLYYDGKPFTGLYYELFPEGNLELYIKYQDGLPVEDCFEFYENGKMKTYSHYSKDRRNSYSFSYDEKGKLKLSSVWENGKFTQKIYDEN